MRRTVRLGATLRERTRRGDHDSDSQRDSRSALPKRCGCSDEGGQAETRGKLAEVVPRLRGRCSEDLEWIGVVHTV